MLESEVDRYKQIFWRPLDADEKRQLTSTLVGLGRHSVAITANVNTDCTELARDLRECFEQAGWEIAKVPLTGSIDSIVNNGFIVGQKTKHGAFNTVLVGAVDEHRRLLRRYRNNSRLRCENHAGHGKCLWRAREGACPECRRNGRARQNRRVGGFERAARDEAWEMKRGP
jgi:hypothetical protein